MHTHHLRFGATTACFALLLSLATTNAAPRAQVDNANQNTTSKSARKKATRRPKRQTPPHATAKNPSLPKPETPPVTPHAASTIEPTAKGPTLPAPATLNVDPALYREIDPALYRDLKPRNSGGEMNGGMGTRLVFDAGRGRGGNAGSTYSPSAGPGINEEGGVVDYNRPFPPRYVDIMARILERPDPEYTEEAKQQQISGTILIRAIFSSSGKVTNIRAVNELPYGLTEQAIKAARKIKFEPAMKDGRVVSQFFQILYHFNLY